MTTDFTESSVEGDRQIKRIAERQNLSYVEATNVWLAKQQPSKPAPAGGFDKKSLDADAKIRDYARKHNLLYTEASDRLCSQARLMARDEELTFSEAFDDVLACV